MNVYTMTFDELTASVREASELLREVADEKPALAMLLHDAMELALREGLVHLCKGDRAAAEAMWRNRTRGDH